MALPSGISTCLVTFGTATSFLGTEAGITGRLTADRAVVWEETGTRLMQVTEELPGDGSSLSFYVPHVDQDGFLDAVSVEPTTFWTYTLTAMITLNGQQIPVTRNFQPLVGQDVLDLDLVADGPTTPGVTAPYAVVTSIGGLTGDVTFADLAAGGIGLDTGWHILTGLDVPSTPDFFAYYRRIGNQVTFVMGAELGAVTVIDGAIPTALLPDFPPNMDIGFAGLDQSSTELVGYLFTSTGAIYSTNPSGFGNSTSNYFTWTTSQPFPAMPYPGTPA